MVVVTSRPFIHSIISCWFDVSKVDSPLLRDLLLRIFTKNASDRLSMLQVLQHPWMIQGGGSQQTLFVEPSGGNRYRVVVSRDQNRDGGSGGPSSGHSSGQSSGIPCDMVEELELDPEVKRFKQDDDK